MSKVQAKKLFYRFVLLALFIGLVGLFYYQQGGQKQNKEQENRSFTPSSTPRSQQNVALPLSSMPLSLQMMSDTQKQKAIAAAVRDAFAAALASGQSEKMAHIAAERARQAAQTVFYATKP